MNLELLHFGHAAGTYPVTFLEQGSFLLGVVFIPDFMADLVVDRPTFLAVAPFGDLNMFAATGDHDDSSNNSRRFGFSLESRKKVSS